MIGAKGRYSYAQAILGRNLFERVQDSGILCVGAGGIGCEVLKNLVQCGFRKITIIDLDTIDLSNLNRQFLFQKQHVKRSKALVARETALKFNPHIDIKAIHGNIKEPQYDVDWFQTFDVVLNALDNLDARRHVNKMCLAADVPLIESGTAGFIGQVQPIKKGLTECYDCQPKETPKGFPVCTIRSTPSTPIHCIVWAKSYLFPALFGIDDESDSLELDKAAQSGENPTEIDNLRKEALQMKALRQSAASPDFQKQVIEKVFTEDVNRLLVMEDMWKHRTKPIPLNYQQLLAAPSTSQQQSGKSTIRDQRVLTVKDSFDLMQDSLSRLAARVQKDSFEPLEWDKDDDDALDFAVSAANLRASVFGIPLKTRFDVKQMAGNIIPAIATTNAIIAGAQILQLIHALKAEWRDAKAICPLCSTCRTPYIPIKIDSKSLTVERFKQDILHDWLAIEYDVSMVDGTRIIYDPDFGDNAEKTFDQLHIGQGSHLQINDEDGDKMPITFVISNLLNSKEQYVLPLHRPSIPSQPKLSATVTDTMIDTAPSRKRTASAAELDRPDTKKLRTETGPNGAIILEDDDDLIFL